MRSTKIYYFFLFLLAYTAASAQEGPWRLGLSAGGSQYVGDLNPNGQYTPPFFDNPQLQDLSLSAFLEKSLSEGIGLQLRYSQGALEANDRARDFQGNLQTDAPYFERALNMRSEWYSADLSFRFQTGTQTWFRPYFMLGFGGLYFQSYADLFTENGQRYYYWTDGNIYDAPEGNANANRIEQDGIFETELQPLSTEQQDYNPWTWQLPLAAGFDIKLSHRLFLQLEYRFVFSGSDYLDDVSGDYPQQAFTDATAAYASNPSGYTGRRGTAAERFESNDIYQQVQIGVVVHLGRMQRRFQPPIFYTPPSGRPSNQGIPEVPENAKTYLDTLLMPMDSSTNASTAVPQEKSATETSTASGNGAETQSSTSSTTAENTAAATPEVSNEELQQALLRELRAERLRSMELQAELLRLRQEKAPADSLLERKAEADLAKERLAQLAQLTEQQAENTALSDSLRLAVDALKGEVRNLQKLVQLPPTAQLDSNLLQERQAALVEEKEALSKQLEEMPETQVVLLPLESDSTANENPETLPSGPSETEQQQLERLDALKNQLSDLQADLQKQQKRGTLDSAYYAQLQQQMAFLNRVIDQLSADIETPQAATPPPAQLDDTALWQELQSQRSLLREQAQTLRELKESLEANKAAPSNSSTAASPSQAALDWLAQAKVHRLYFPRGSSRLSEEQQAKLQELLTELKAHPRIQIQLQGYSDTTGTELENYRLARARASRTAAFLQEQGIAAERLQVVYFGATQAKGEDREERRVELHFNLK